MLVQIVDRVMAEAVRRSGNRLACRPGCAQCCFGPFRISPEDAARLRDGLRRINPAAAERIQTRAFEAIRSWAPAFPGDPATGVLAETEEAEEAFDTFANDQACPALDPATGTCDLYAWRPLQCRTFGPPVKWGDDGVAICELCFVGASDEEIAECAVELPPETLDFYPATIVAFALAIRH